MERWIILPVISLLASCGEATSDHGGGAADPYYTVVTQGKTETTRHQFDFAEEALRLARQCLKKDQIPDIDRIVLVADGRSGVSASELKLNVHELHSGITPEYVASVLVHEQCHVDRNFACSREEESICIARQIEFLEKAGGSHAEIRWLEGQVGKHTCST